MTSAAMTAEERPPYRAALAVAAAVLAVYVVTLAPTVTFWDAGEFIAAARTLGIPHPPGTPLFVMIAHTWGLLVPLGEFAYRTNLLSALFSASGAGFLFLVVHQSTRGVVEGLPEGSARALRLGGAATAALLGAFTFTNWQNSNESEVYTVATFTTGAMAWAAMLWRSRRHTGRGERFLLLIVYLAGISIGNHLLALLAVPGVLLFLVATLRHDPAPQAERRRTEWGQVAVLAGVWALLVGTGLGNIGLTAVGAVCFLAAAAYAALGGAGAFAGAALALAAVGVTPYLFLYLRSAQHPLINEADPSTLDALLAVIRRAQYPPRTPFDDPTELHGPDNPGRTLTLVGWQLANYFQYFDWQWARSLGDGLRQVVTIVFLTLGLRGLWEQRRSDRAAWWLLLGIFLVTGLGLVAYMNFRPGFSLAFHRWPEADDHEVRERDYFFVVSFIVWGLWAGIGAAAFAADLARRATSRLIAPALLLVAVVPLVLNWSKASRRHGPDARLAADFAYDLLNSAPPYGILFTYGDNDTFPLWWAQEVAGIRQDVTVVCLALANTDWYMRQLRDNPVRPVDPAQVPALWRNRIPAAPPAWPVHGMTDSMIASAMNGYLVNDSTEVRLGPVTRRLAAGSVLYPNDIVSMSIVQHNAGKRPVVWSVTAGTGFAGLRDYVVQRGLGFELQTSRPDTTSPDLDLRRLAGAPLHLPDTEALVYGTYRYAGLLEHGAAGLDPTSASAAASLALPPVQLVYAYESRGDRERMKRAISLASKLTPNPQLKEALLHLPEQLSGDSVVPQE
jgi:Protein O-mannosyl-transferase TMEM260-like